MITCYQLIVVFLVTLLIPVLTTLCAHKNLVHTQFSFDDCHGFQLKTFFNIEVLNIR